MPPVRRTNGQNRDTQEVDQPDSSERNGTRLTTQNGTTSTSSTTSISVTANGPHVSSHSPYTATVRRQRVPTPIPPFLPPPVIFTDPSEFFSGYRFNPYASFITPRLNSNRPPATPRVTQLYDADVGRARQPYSQAEVDADPRVQRFYRLPPTTKLRLICAILDIIDAAQ